MEMSSLWIFLLLSTAVTGDNTTSITARLGQDVSLPCGNVIKHQPGCDRMSWLFSRQDVITAKELITNGNISKSEAAQAMRGRLHVSADCSLVIKSVCRDDVGRYTCRQFTPEKEYSDSMVLLSVIDISSDDTFRFYCNVFRYGECEHTVQWDYKGDNEDLIKNSDHTCFATVTFNTVPDIKESGFKKQLYCNVTDKKSGQTLLCDAIDGSSCERTGRGGTSTGPESGPPSKPDWLPFVLAAVGLAVLFLVLVVSVVFIRRRKLKGQQRPRDDINEDPDVAVAYASVSYTKTINTNKMRAAGPDEGDAVIYSALRVSPPEPEASADASTLYTTVN